MDHNYNCISLILMSTIGCEGKINIMNQVEREAMEIAFNVPARLIERIFSNNPKESYFVAGPELAGPEEEQQREEGRNYSGLSILDLAPLF